MAYLIDTIKDTIGNIIYPITQTKAVFDVKSNKYQNDLNDIAVFSEDLTSDIQQDVKLNADTLNNHPDTYFAKQSDISDVNTSLNILNDDRGYLTSKHVNFEEYLDATKIKNGVYTCWAQGEYDPRIPYSQALIMTGYDARDIGALIMAPNALYYGHINANTPKYIKEIATTETKQLATSDMLNGWNWIWNEIYLPRITRVGNIVHVTGLISGGTTAKDTVLFNIGYSPSTPQAKEQFLYSENTTKISQMINVNTTGDVTIAQTGFANSPMMLDFTVNL